MPEGKSEYHLPDLLLGGPLLSPPHDRYEQISLSFLHSPWLASPVQVLSGAPQVSPSRRETTGPEKADAFAALHDRPDQRTTSRKLKLMRRGAFMDNGTCP